MSWFMGSSSNDRPRGPSRSYSTPTYTGTAHSSSGRKHSSSHHKRSSSPSYSVHSTTRSAHGSEKPQYYEVRHHSGGHKTGNSNIEYRRSVNGHGHGSYGGGSSYYRRSRAMPRSGYLHRLMHKIKRMLRELYRYVRRHPIKVLLPLVMAVISSGALHQVARRMGVPIPSALAQMVGAGRSVKGGYDAWYGDDRDDGYGYSERKRYSRREESSGGLGGLLGGGGDGGMLRGAMKVASAFL